jgi:ABC-2 type transport system ATP-binding protein
VREAHGFDGREPDAEPTRVLHELTTAAMERGEELEGLEVRKPSLEEVYLTLVDAEQE